MLELDAVLTSVLLFFSLKSVGGLQLSQIKYSPFCSVAKDTLFLLACV